MPPLLILEETNALNSGDESDDDLISTEMLENIRDKIQSHPNVNMREAHNKIRDSIKQRQPEWKEELKSTQKHG